MSNILRRLNYGIFPIASRRHQGRTSSYHVIHEWDHTSAWSVVILWLFTPVMAALGPLFGKFDYGESFFLIVLLNLWLTWEIKRSG